jgi:hypothetical protein
MKNITFGSDPEFMLVDLKGNYRSAIEVVPGTQEDRASLGNGHFAFYDNVLAEVNISPAASAKEAVGNFRDCFQRLATLIGTQLRLKIQASQVYPKKECCHPDAMVFGCDPEYNIHLRTEDGRIRRVDPPIMEEGNTFRSAGGHIHVGHELALPWHNPVVVVEMMDIIVGLPAILLDNDPTSLARRKIYGGAGTHRLCLEYGIEYRSLSNFWLASPTLVKLMYDLSNHAVSLIHQHKNEKITSLLDMKKVETAINGNQKKDAKALLKEISKYMPSKLQKKIDDLSNEKEGDFYKTWDIQVTA